MAYASIPRVCLKHHRIASTRLVIERCVPCAVCAVVNVWIASDTDITLALVALRVSVRAGRHALYACQT